MAALMLDDRRIINKKYPFLAYFPFEDFTLEVGDLPSAPTSGILTDSESDSKASKYDSQIVRFVYESGTKFSISIHENDLNWVYGRAQTVQELDTIAKKVELGLSTVDILTKRDSVEDADAWIKLLSDDKTMLAYSTFTAALTNLIGTRSLAETTKLINNINKLANKKGLVTIGKEDYAIIMTYYQFRLVYTKLILGLVIAAKISL